MNKPLSPKFVTPKGTAVWPKLNTPDTKFNVDGEYSVKIRLPVADSQDLIKQLEGLRDEYQAAQSKTEPKVARYDVAPVYETEEDDNGDVTGFVLFKFKQNAKIKLRNGGTRDMSVPIYDSNKAPTKTEVTGGSIIRVAANVFCYAMPSSKKVGVSLRPTGVQIIELAAGFGGDADALAMFDKEDGFVADSFDVAAGVDDLADF
jgi:hypothetical protein